MRRIFVVENEARDAERFRSLFRKEGFEVECCDSGAAAEPAITPGRSDVAAAFICWEAPGPPFAFTLLARCRKHWPAVPVVITSGMFDAVVATRAHALGARDFLEKPLDSGRVVSCLRALLADDDPFTPLVEQLRRTIVGESLALLVTLRQLARVIPHADSRVLFVGESGAGKELFARAVHDLGDRATEPWVAVNIAEIPAPLIESALFGHEKGTFTGATTRRTGFLEQAGAGTLFLDEIGKLELTLQVKLLRAIQDKKFQRIGGEAFLNFNARLVSATNRDLTQAVKEGTFRQDLFHRIAEVSIHIPPLRERTGDVDVLLAHFLDSYREGRAVRFTRESRSVLRSYPYPGNVRELQNLVKSALIECDGAEILPGHLPLQTMKTFLLSAVEVEAPPPLNQEAPPPFRELFHEIAEHLPANWIEARYREIAPAYIHAFDRIYLKYFHEKTRCNISLAAEMAGLDVKTFRKRWKECGLQLLALNREDG